MNHFDCVKDDIPIQFSIYPQLCKIKIAWRIYRSHRKVIHILFITSKLWRRAAPFVPFTQYAGWSASINTSPLHLSWPKLSGYSLWVGISSHTCSSAIICNAIYDAREHIESCHSLCINLHLLTHHKFLTTISAQMQCRHTWCAVHV